MNIENINKMIELSIEKKKKLNEILNLTKEQTRLIVDDNLDEMEKLLQNKQKHMEDIDRLDIEFLKLYGELKKSEGIESISNIDLKKYSNLKDLKNQVKSINSVLDKISELDKKNTEKMKKNLKDVQKNIKNVRDGKKAYKGYNADQNPSIMIDEKK